MSSFTEAYVFPDGELAPIHEIFTPAKMAGFEVHSTENMRNHYALILRHWVHPLEDQADKARIITDDVTYRVWRLLRQNRSQAVQFQRFRAAKISI